jgi:DNA-binding PadR family transcriptional regulator
MPAACPAAGGLDPGIFAGFRPLGELLTQVRDAVRAMTGGDGPGWRGSWDKGFGGPKRGSQGPGGWGSRAGGWWPPGPSGPFRAPQKAGRGDVRAAILALLQEGPRNGYQIMSEIEERSDGAWRPSPGAVYPALQLLADEGLIEAEESAGRRTFSLTDAGRRHIEEHPESARAAWESMATDDQQQVPGLFVQAARLGASIVQMAHSGTAEQVRAAEEVLEQARRTIYQILAGEARTEPGDK